MSEAANALRQAQVFLSDVTGPPDSDDEQRRLTSTLHALDHASRLAETASEAIDFGTVRGGPDDVHAGQLCADAMRSAALVAGEVAAPHDIIQSPQVTFASLGADAKSGAAAVSTEEALVRELLGVKWNREFMSTRPKAIAPAGLAGACALQLIRLHWRAFFGSESQTSTSGNGFKSGSNAPSAS